MPIVARRRVEQVTVDNEAQRTRPRVRHTPVLPEPYNPPLPPDFPMPAPRRRLAPAPAAPTPTVEVPVAPEPIVKTPSKPNVKPQAKPTRRRVWPDEPEPTSPAQTPEPAVVKPKRRRGHAKKDANGKWLPTSDYPNGFARAPLANRFDGSKAGPGRPKGSRSQASILKEELNSKQVVRVNGKSKQITKRELVSKLWIKGAIEKAKHKELSDIIEIATRLFPEAPAEEASNAQFANSALDKEVLAQFFAAMALGEPIPGAAHPLDEAFVPSAPSDDPPASAGDEESWDAPGAIYEDDEAPPGADDPDDDKEAGDWDEEDDDA